MTITNGSPGLSSVKLVVNGQAFWATGLGDGEERYLDIASALLPGRDDIVEVTSYGPPGSTATLFIAN